MWEIVNKIKYYVLDHPTLINTLKFWEDSTYMQWWCAWSWASFFTVAPMLPIMWYLYKNKIINRSTLRALWAFMVLSSLILWLFIMIENGLFKR